MQAFFKNSWCGCRDLNPGYQLGKLNYEGYSLNWADYRAEFIEYLQSKRYNERYAQNMLNYLDKNISIISKPMDVVRIFAKLTLGQQHNLIRAFRVFLNFVELKGTNINYLNSLKKAIPKDHVGIDLRIPTEKEIILSLKKLKDTPPKYQVLYNLLLDSGLRLIEAVRFINGNRNIVKIKEFYRCTLGYFRGSKIAYAAYFTAHTNDLLKRGFEDISYSASTRYYSKNKFIAPKYLRKFAFNTMISESFNFPETVADFIEGRVPRKIGAKHYASLLKQADGFYGRYNKYIDKLHILSIDN